MHKDNKLIKEDVDRLIKQVQEDRKARGLPPESPKPFVPIAMGWVLFQRCKPLIDYTIEYANIVDKANEIVELNEEQKDWINQHEMYATLICKTDDTLLNITGGGLIGIINLLNNQSDYELVGEYLRKLFRCIYFTKSDYGEYQLSQFTYDYESDSKKNERILDKTIEEVERLKDDDYFNQELEKLIEHYESIKHLY